MLAYENEEAPYGIVGAGEMPAERLDESRLLLISKAPASTFHLLNGSITGFELVHRHDPEKPDGPSNHAFVHETMTSIDTMLARLCIEHILKT